MGVIARTSSMAYKGTDKTVARIGQELGVDYILEGSVRQDKERIRITAQLIRVQDQIHLWADSFDRQLRGILEIHGEIGAAIAAQVKLELISPVGRPSNGYAVENPEAHDHYLRGRYHYARSNRQDMQKAIEFFKSATRLDPNYTLAYSGLADALLILPITGDVASKEVFPAAKTAVSRALQLAPNSAEAHTSDATAKFWFDWDFAGAEAAARRALQLNENYSLAHLYLAHVLSNVGRHVEALAVIRQGMVLDPYSLITAAMRGQFLYHAGRNSEAIAQFRASLDMEPRFWVGQICLAKAYEKEGRYCDALTACNRAWEFSGGNTEAVSVAGYVHAVSGNRAEAESKIQQMLDIRKDRYVPPYNLALVFAGLDQTEAALNHLEQAFEDRDVHMPFLLDHKWDRMRSNRRFQEILEMVRLQ
jgi:tetratricopeptide (TPR) repeat protein